MSQIDGKMFFLAVIFSICGVSNAEVFKVGDSRGWTDIGDINYQTWSASKEFHVGDIILFEYAKEFHNVVRVTHENYNTCNGTSPYQVWNSGNDTFTIENSGHYFFISTLMNQCEKGRLKVDIRVPKTQPPSGNVAPPPLPPPSSSSSPESDACPTRWWSSKLDLVFVIAFSLSLFCF